VVDQAQEMGSRRALRWYDYITVNINWFALTTRSQVLTALLLPLLVQRFIGEASKGEAVGTLRLWGLMVALLIQALMGIFSDRLRSRWGRRRPFIFFGVLVEVLVFLLIGFSTDLQGTTGYWVLFTLNILSMVGSNASQAATQGLIPDLVPDAKKGRFSGIKAALELPIPLIFVSFVAGPMVAKGNLWGALLALIVVLVVCMLLSMLVPERAISRAPTPINWQPVLRLLAMTAVFTGIILGMREVVKWVIQGAVGMGANAALLLVGGVGLLTMGIAISLGVWLSVRISIGDQADRDSSFTWWTINRLAFLVGANNLASFVLFFLQEKFDDFSGNAAAGPASRILMFVGIFILLTAIPSGWLADRVGKKLLITLAGILAAIGAGVIVLTSSLNSVYVGACIIGAGVGLFYSSSWALGTEIVPRERAGQFLGISNLAGAGAGAVGAYIGGPIADSASYVLLMSIYGLIMLLSIAAIARVREPAPMEV